MPLIRVSNIRWATILRDEMRELAMKEGRRSMKYGLRGTISKEDAKMLHEQGIKIDTDGENMEVGFVGNSPPLIYGISGDTIQEVVNRNFNFSYLVSGRDVEIMYRAYEVRRDGDEVRKVIAAQAVRFDKLRTEDLIPSWQALCAMDAADHA